MLRFRVCHRRAAFSKATVLALAAAVIVASAVEASADGSASIVLSGTVPARSVLSVSLHRPIEGLYSDADGRRILMAVVREASSLKTGYRIILTSMNAVDQRSDKPFVMGAALADTTRYSYAVIYGGEEVVFVSGSAVVSDVRRRTPPSVSATELWISCELGSPLSQTKAFSDTLIFSVEAR